MRILTGSKMFLENAKDTDYLVFSDTQVERQKGQDLFIVPTDLEKVREKDGFYLVMTYIFYQELGLEYNKGNRDYFKEYFDNNINRLAELLEHTKERYINADTSWRKWWFEGATNYLANGETGITKDYIQELDNQKQAFRQARKNSPEYLDYLRNKREKECFSVIDRGKLWYDTLTQERLDELETWYNAWLQVTETKVIPERLDWL